MAKVCDNKSVGMLVWNENGRLLMIERSKYNPGIAVPAGHLDGDDPETGARRELSEEVGLSADKVEEVLQVGLPNPCKREGGTRHDWTIFRITRWAGTVKQSPDEVKTYFWADREKIRALAERLEKFAQSQNISLGVDGSGLPQLVAATNADPSWQQNPGLEPPMYFLFKELGII